MSGGIGGLSAGFSAAQQLVVAHATTSAKTENTESKEATSINEGAKPALPEAKRDPIQTGVKLNVEA